MAGTSAIIQYILAIPNAVLTWATFFAAGLVVVGYKIFRNNRPKNLKEVMIIFIPFDPIKSKSFHGDIKSFIILGLRDIFLKIPEIIFISAIGFWIANFIAATLGETYYPKYNISENYYVIIFMIFVLEFSYYVDHYLNHKLPFLWELHKVHHSANVLTPLTDKRAHFLSSSIRTIIVAFISGIPAGVFGYYFEMEIYTLVTTSGISISLLRYATLYPLKHSHFPLGFGPLDWIFQSPHMHQVHHSDAERHWDKNLGINLSIFDWIFGTGYRPARGEVLTFGIGHAGEGEPQQFDTLGDLYIVPLKKSFNCLRSSLVDRRGCWLKVKE